MTSCGVRSPCHLTTIRGDPSHLCVEVLSVQNTIHRITLASIIVPFYQGVRDEKMLEKLMTHNIQDVKELLTLAD